jgi:CheY-like chemotaxis protein
VVDDEAAVLRVVERVLAAEGYRVLTAASAKRALEVGEAHPGKIDLLLTDVVMPEMNGGELADQLKAVRAHKQTGMGVLFMSGYTGDVILEHGVSGESVAFLRKPLTPETLAQGVRETLDRSRSPSP